MQRQLLHLGCSHCVVVVFFFYLHVLLVHISLSTKTIALSSFNGPKWAIIDLFVSFQHRFGEGMLGKNRGRAYVSLIPLIGSCVRL